MKSKVCSLFIVVISVLTLETTASLAKVSAPELERRPTIVAPHRTQILSAPTGEETASCMPKLRTRVKSLMRDCRTALLEFFSQERTTYVDLTYGMAYEADIFSNRLYSPSRVQGSQE